MPAPTITSISPTAGLDSASYTVTIGGTGFEAGITNIRLTRTGFSDIVATGVSRDSAIQCTATFALSGKRPGEWYVQVTNPIGGAGTSATALFTVASGPVATITTAPDAAEVQKAPDVGIDPMHPTRGANALLSSPNAAEILTQDIP